MEDNRFTIWEKIARYVSGNASAENKTWVQEQQELELGFTDTLQQTEKVWSRSKVAVPPAAYEPDVDRGWQRFQARVQVREEQAPAPSPAAVHRKMYPNTWYGIAASIALFILVGFYFINRATSPTWIEVSTAANETKIINLADGSTIALNQNSTFAYLENFQKENRTVRLTGEAFFEVAKAEGKRFTIFAEGTKTEVIGTSFNLRAYKKEPVKVQVVTGKVAFARTETDNAVFLVPGQEGIIPAEGEKVAAVKKPIADPNFRSWQTKSFTFNNTRLAELVQTLEKDFNVTITLQNQDLKNCRFTSSFNNPDIKEILDILAIAGNLKITQDGNRYTISGSGCK